MYSWISHSSCFICCTILPFTPSKSRLSHRSIVNVCILLILQNLAIMENLWPWHSLAANIRPLRTEVPPLATCISDVLQVSPLYMTGKPWDFGLCLCLCLAPFPPKIWIWIQLHIMLLSVHCGLSIPPKERD
jgi:hypothetical protein